MRTDPTDLASLFHKLTDDELLYRYGSNTLTDAAKIVALEEINRRGLEAPMPEAPEPEDADYAGDFEMVARYLNPTDAHVVCSCLKMAGIPAVVADAQLVQTNSLWAVALGGARILVPALHVAEAKAVIAAFERGEFALRDDDKSVE